MTGQSNSNQGSYNHSIAHLNNQYMQLLSSMP